MEYFGFFANEPKFISAMQILFLTVWSLSTWVFCDWFSLSSKPIFPSKTYSPPAFLISKNETTLPRLLGEYLRHFCYLLNLYIPSIILSLLWLFYTPSSPHTLLWTMVNKNERKSELLVTNYLQFTNWDWVCNAHVLSLSKKHQIKRNILLYIIRIYDYVL